MTKTKFGFNLSDEMIMQLMMDVTMQFMENDMSEADEFMMRCFAVEDSDNPPYKNYLLMTTAIVFAKIGQVQLHLSEETLYNKLVDGSIIKWVFGEYLVAHPEFFDTITNKDKTMVNKTLMEVHNKSDDGDTAEKEVLSDEERFRLVVPWVNDLQKHFKADKAFNSKMNFLLDRCNVDKDNDKQMMQFVSGLVMMHRYQMPVEEAEALATQNKALDVLFSHWLQDTMTIFQSDLMGVAPTASIH